MKRYTIFFIAVSALHCSAKSPTLSVAANKLYIYQMLCVQLSCWWWAEKPPETCRPLTAIRNIVQRCILLVILKWKRIYNEVINNFRGTQLIFKASTLSQKPVNKSISFKVSKRSMLCFKKPAPDPSSPELIIKSRIDRLTHQYILYLRTKRETCFDLL